MDEEEFPEEYEDWFNPFPMHVYAKVTNGRYRISGKSKRVEIHQPQEFIGKFNIKF